MNDARAGFLLTRHWRDTPAGREVVLWLATDSGPQQVVLPPQESVAFIPAGQQEAASRLLAGDRHWRFAALELTDCPQRPVVGLYC
ncbi:DNA polymerase II, partial [Erwinia amylovora]|nr:DNA polymerase II [Erwinia amylovora]